MTDDHMTRALAVTEKIMAKAEEALAPFRHEMVIRQWAPEFRKIMWDAVSQVAAAYSEDAAAKGTKVG